MNFVAWIAWTANGQGYLFRAPEAFSKHQACELAEKTWDKMFVTVELFNRWLDEPKPKMCN